MPEEARPRLVAVDSQAESARAAAATSEPPRGRAPWLAVGVLAMLLVLAATAWVQVSRQVRNLEALLASTRGDLRDARAAVGAHESHLEDVRAAVAELDALVARDPTAGN